MKLKSNLQGIIENIADGRDVDTASVQETRFVARGP
jgi:hypothetical protein